MSSEDDVFLSSLVPSLLLSECRSSTCSGSGHGSSFARFGIVSSPIQDDSGGGGVAVRPMAVSTPSTAAERTLCLEAGAVLGPFEIIDRLGSGGMGDVYRA